MHVFVTGATGFVGSAVVKELLANSHTVIGLARSDASADALALTGAEVQRGTLEDHDSLRNGVRKADAVIHAGFNHDFTRFAENCAVDEQAILAMGAELEGTDRPLLATAGVAFVPHGCIATETDPALAPNDQMPRASEQAVAALVERGVRASVVRLPPSVHGAGDHGFVPMMIAIAREKGLAAYPENETFWSSVHRFDAAKVYRLAIERGALGGPFNAVAEEGIPLRDIAEVIGRKLAVSTGSLSPDQAPAHFGPFASFAMLDRQASSEQTRTILGWVPTEPGLIADLEADYYFDAGDT